MKILIALIKYNTCKKLNRLDLRAMVAVGLKGKAHKIAECYYLRYNQH